MAKSMKGTKTLSKRLRKLPEHVEEAVRPALTKSAGEIHSLMQHLAPVDEGDLRNSIEITLPGETTPPYSQPGGSHTAKLHEVLITAGNSAVRYPHIVEYGSTKTDAQPFFWPAYRLLKKRVTGRIKRALTKAAKEGFNR